ncbi:MAG: HXXEE domain-containing protein [Pseudomonadota bacterium]
MQNDARSGGGGQLVALLIFMAMLWVPVGQSAFLADHWMKIGTYMAPVAVFMGLKMRQGSAVPPLQDVTFVAVLLAAAYLTHQFEEHWVNLRGEVYPLRHELNSIIAAVLGEDKYGIMTRDAIFYINTGAVWASAFVAIWASPRLIFPSMAMAGLTAVNGFAHMMVAIRTFDYNSGLLTGVLIFLPLTILYFRTLLKTGLATRQMVVISLAWGIFGHVLLFGGLVLANVMGVIPVEVYYAALIAYGFAPLAFFRQAA